MSYVQHDNTSTQRTGHVLTLLSRLIRPALLSIVKPSLAEPGFLEPGFRASSFVEPRFTLPKLALPGLKLPTITLPRFTALNVMALSIKPLSIKPLSIRALRFVTPPRFPASSSLKRGFFEPRFTLPKLTMPGLKLPSITLPRFTALNVTALSIKPLSIKPLGINALGIKVLSFITVLRFPASSSLKRGFFEPRFTLRRTVLPTITLPTITLPTIKGMLLSTAFISIAAVLGISTAGGSFASWNGADSVAAGTVKAGTLSITVNNSANFALSGTAWSSLLPGDVVSQQVSVKNTGTTLAALTANTSAPSGAIEVRVKSGACSGTIVGPSSTVTPTLLAGTLAGGATVTVCIQVSLAASAVQNQVAPFTTTFTADQVHP